MTVGKSRRRKSVLKLFNRRIKNTTDVNKMRMVLGKVAASKILTDRKKLMLVRMMKKQLPDASLHSSIDGFCEVLGKRMIHEANKRMGRV